MGGLIDQQFTSGKYQGCVHLNNEIRGLSGALINGGNSGGPLLATFQEKEHKAIQGLHYFVPTKYKVMGINTFKLTGANVDGKNVEKYDYETSDGGTTCRTRNRRSFNRQRTTIISRELFRPRVSMEKQGNWWYRRRQTTFVSILDVETCCRTRYTPHTPRWS